MSLLNTLSTLAGSQAGSAASLIPALIEQINKYPGGLSGLVERFQKGGLGDVVSSWVGTGPNLPVSAQQLDGVLDPGMVDAVATRTGQERGSVLESLTSLLPKLVDQATPDGALGAGQGLDPAKLLGSLAGLLDGRGQAG
ncbi:hypothetical protein CEK29_14345 [Bordetella genomosp. 5]|uniref:DUF937 domain-containing protein n=1 Tax=Bordetella genomosp. 5 TaxID=1395608 RepID=A0A261THT3_9BORD|nr:YidB family protein [Bordetella genomosp. 5]OZI42246.1 hypothetical protein CEK29_14345 [Bordetella genomosp. 5]OZI49238.1 hypothetical protein CAL25_14475 [Bordetella genomosp. 5]